MLNTHKHSHGMTDNPEFCCGKWNIVVRLSESREKDDYPGLPVIHLTDVETPNDLLWVGSSTKACTVVYQPKLSHV
jgi:hypothetical protein